VRAGWLAIRHPYEGLFCVSDGVLDQTPRTRRPAVYRVAQTGLVFSSFCNDWTEYTIERISSPAVWSQRSWCADLGSRMFPCGRWKRAHRCASRSFLGKICVSLHGRSQSRSRMRRRGCLPIPSVIYGGSFLASSLNVLVQRMCVSTKIPRSVVFVDLRGPETSARVVCCCTSHAL
jgi:hypothetical protein